MSTNTTRQKVKALEREVDTLKTTVINLERFANNTVGELEIARKMISASWSTIDRLAKEVGIDLVESKEK